MLSLLEMSLAGGIIIVAVVIIRALAIHRLPKQAFLALWGLALLRLALPFTIPSPVSLYSAANRVAAVRRPGLLLAGTQAAAEEAQVSAEVPVLLLVWLGGAAAVALFFLVTHLLSRRRYRASLPLESPSVKGWLEQNRLRRPVQVRYSDQISAPLTYGVLWPVILLPKGLEEDEGRLSFVLAHELAHIRRCDCLIKWLLAAVLAAHWFNPLVWVLYVLSNRDLELSCDESVVRRYGAGARAPYALTLVGMAEQGAGFSPLSSSFSKHALEERITAIMKSKQTTIAGIVAALVLVGTFAAVFATSAARAPETAAAPEPPRAAVGAIADAVTDTTLAATEYGWDTAVDPKTGLHYTQEQYNKVAALKTKGYETLSIAEFNRKVHAAFELYDQGYETSLNNAYELVAMDIKDDDPLAGFVRNTLRASQDEYDARLTEVYSGKANPPSFSGSAAQTWTKDVYGDPVTVGEAQMDYQFTYKILDQNKLTVKERDQFLQDIMAGMQTFLEEQAATTIKADENNASTLCKAELDRLGASLSTGNIKYVSGTIDSYYYYDNMEWEAEPSARAASASYDLPQYGGNVISEDYEILPKSGGASNGYNFGYIKIDTENGVTKG